MHRLIFSFAILMLALTGCPGNRLPPEADPAQGRDALKTVLDAWVKGAKPNDLKGGSPSIVTHDPDWAEGHKLLKYEIDPTESRSGVDLRLTVTLTLKNPKGQTIQKQAVYVISTSPVLTVLRNDPDS